MQRPAVVDRRDSRTGILQRWSADPLWYSPPTLLLLLAAAVHGGWLITFLAHLWSGDRQYAFPGGLHQVISRHLPDPLSPHTDALVIVYNVALAGTPLLPLAWPSFREWSRAAGVALVNWVKQDYRRASRSVAVIIAVLIIVLAAADHTRLPYVQERVRWATDWFPLPVPFVPGEMVRLEYFLTRVVDARYSFVLVNAIFYMVLVAFTIRFWGGTAVAVPATLGAVTVLVHHKLFWFLNGAEAAVPGAVLGLIGTVLIARGQTSGGTAILMAAMLFRPEAFFYAFLAGILVIREVVRGGRRLRQVPWALGIVCAGTALLHSAGMLAGNAIVLTPTFAFATPNPFYVGAFTRFLAEFAGEYSWQILLAVGGILWSPRDRGLLAFLFLGMLVVRPLIALAGGYYTIIFVPIWALAASGLFVRLWNGLPLATRSTVLKGRLAAGGLLFAGVLVSVPGFRQLADPVWTTRATTGWDGVIEQLHNTVPHRATVYFRKVSPRYDLERRGRMDLRFRELGEDPAASRMLLAESGPILVIVRQSDLATLGDLTGFGYTTALGRFGPTDDEFVMLLKRD